MDRANSICVRVQQRRRESFRCGIPANVTICGLYDFRCVGHGYGFADSEEEEGNTEDEDTDNGVEGW